MNKDERFPTDWNEWRKLWNEWRAYGEGRALTTVRKSFPGKNFLADEVLGVWRLPSGRIVELSEVTFPNLEERDANGRLKDYRVRSVGITFSTGADASGGTVHTFRELEQALGLSDL